MEMTIEEQKAYLDQLFDRKLAVMVAKSRGLPDTKTRDVWLEWERRGFPTGKDTARKGAKVCMGHKGLILDLAFEHDGVMLRLGDVPMSAVTGDMGESWRRAFQNSERKAYDIDSKTYVWPAELSEVGKEGYKRPDEPFYEPSYINRAVATLTGFFTWKCKGRVNNPLRGLGILKYNKSPRKGCYFANELQLDEFLSHCHPTLQDMARLSVNSGGMRKGEVRHLETGWVVWEEQKIILPAHATKNGEEREFPVLAPQLEMLQRRRSYADSVGTVLLFSNPRDPKHGLIPDGTIDAWMEEAGRDWGKLLSGIHPPIFHAFRHTWATWCGRKLRQGNALAIIMQQGGWGDHKTALGYIQQGRSTLLQTTAMLGVSIMDLDDEDMAELAEQAERAEAKRASRVSRR